MLWSFKPDFFNKRVRRYCSPTRQLFIKTLYFSKPFTADTLQASHPSNSSRQDQFSNSEGFPEGGEYPVLNKLPAEGRGVQPDPSAAPGCPELSPAWLQGMCGDHFSTGWSSAGLLRAQGTTEHRRCGQPSSLGELGLPQCRHSVLAAWPAGLQGGSTAYVGWLLTLFAQP